ncbi:phosphate ABC transporter permease [Hahella sp. CCB-MM4]|uniref:ABC transporter permease subunit n=1 Tax=Hahella sp. (strain CCB-MM4) TaxID=1926491 RepID=UPI000B9A68EB|nr:ABC transporter permease subunit [Hahella sp. CCB-MM4]OZG75078.1 phosphate ABC transporter permease [Hahella sp. CCB-MM4]
MNEVVTAKAPELDFDTPQLKRYRNIRAMKDKIAKVSIAAGGVSVIVAVTLIFFYLLYEVMPLFKSAEVEQVAEYALPTEGKTAFLAVEEQGEKALRLTVDGNVTFINTADGSLDSQSRLPIPEGVTVTSVNEGAAGSRTLAVGLSNGSVLVFKHDYNITWPDNKRLITPQLVFPYGEEPIILDKENGQPIKSVTLRDNGDFLIIIGATQDNTLKASYFEKSENFLTGDVTLEESDIVMPSINGEIISMQLTPDTRWLYVATGNGKLDMYDLKDREQPDLNARVDAVTPGSKVVDMRFLLGGISLLVANDQGEIVQWFPVRDVENQFHLEAVRKFTVEGGQITQLGIEERRKGFYAVTAAGELGLYNSTAEREALFEQLVDKKISIATLAPRANFLLFETTDGRLNFWKVENEHPDVSWSALWSEVWYEGYEEPDYVWQSSAATNDFEPKYSLMPLAFGTLKAAFYAMLIAMPLAICGALYTAHFMSPTLRRKVKPAIELMEALPTVILGFLAGLFFAPFMEANLPGVFAVLFLMPIGIVLFGFFWSNLPQSFRLVIPDGWEAALLIPVVLLIGWLSFLASPGLETALFDGDMRSWLTNTVGIDFDQRNALVVGAAMGFAVIPTIFSITEDAVFSVPKHLTYGSLALGATPWQTMVRVVLPTASPGIFSAVMIGLGRAVGETMIVLMATGNTPIMDMNIFEGMRTLAANIAVEMPESEVGSSHFRILFLAAFVLFLFTFVVNTLAEFVRQRLRNKYSVI